MPKKITIIENEYASLWFYPESGIVHHKIHKFMRKGLYQELVTAGVECLEKYSATKWLSDNRANPVVRHQDIDWVNTVSVPRAIRAGFKYWALVMPAKEIGKMQMRELSEELGRQGIAVKAYSDPDHAMEWLELVDRAVKKK